MPELILSAVLGYLVGSIPTGLIVCQLLRGVDVRQVASGHTGGTNVSRVAGLGAGAATGIVDVLLGAIAVTVAAVLTDNPWAVTAAGVMVVVGHNWSAFIRLGGGIGLSSLAGALLGNWHQVALETAACLLVFWLILCRLLHVHRARATMLAMLILCPLLWALGLPIHGILLGVLGGIVIIVKTMPDWHREYQ